MVSKKWVILRLCKLCGTNKTIHISEIATSNISLNAAHLSISNFANADAGAALRSKTPNTLLLPLHISIK
jgi:hypothetical protein